MPSGAGAQKDEESRPCAPPGLGRRQAPRAAGGPLLVRDRAAPLRLRPAVSSLGAGPAAPAKHLPASGPEPPDLASSSGPPAQVRQLTRAQLLEFFDAYIAPGGAQTRRLATHVFARSAAPRQLTLDAVSEKGSEPVYYPAPEVNVSFGLGDSLLAEY